MGILLGLPGCDSVTAQTVFSNPTSIPIADGVKQPGIGDPYPSQIEVTGLEGEVDNAKVTVHGFSHTYPDDLALMLVAPDGTFMVLHSDAGGEDDVTGVTFTFSDTALLRVPDYGPLLPGSYRPASYGDDDLFPTPGPRPPPADCQKPGECPQAAPAGTATLNGTFGGLAPNGTWSLYAIDCCDLDTGSITGGWSIALETRCEGCSNATPIVIADAVDTPGIGDPYPSRIEVAGVPGVVSSVTVTIHGFSHTFPDDLALMLVAPDGTFMVLHSDAGGADDVTGVTFTLSDAAFASIPDEYPLRPGSYRPASYGDDDMFPLAGAMPPPADCQPSDSGECPQPAPAGGATLNGIFSGLSPNGTWSLYAIDCCAEDVGSIAEGWSIRIQTAFGDFIFSDGFE